MYFSFTGEEQCDPADIYRAGEYTLKHPAATKSVHTAHGCIPAHRSHLQSGQQAMDVLDPLVL